MSENTTINSRLLWGGIMILFGVLFLFDNLDVLDFGEVMKNFWPLILVAVGVKIILSRKATANVDLSSAGSEANFSTSPAYSTDYLSENRFIGDAHLQINSKAFQGGTASNFIGDVTLDLSGIMLAEGQRNLTVSGFIGDVTLVAPKNVPYAIHASLTIGDLVMFGRKEGGFGLTRVYKSADFDAAITRLNIRVSFFIGDIKII